MNFFVFHLNLTFGVLAVCIHCLTGSAIVMQFIKITSLRRAPAIIMSFPPGSRL